MKEDFSPKDYLNSPKTAPQDGEKIIYVLLSELEPNPFQPRKTFPQNAMDELTQSVREKGVLQPITVRPNPNPDSPFRFQIAAGERRTRASKAAGLSRIPAIIKQLSDEDMRDVGIIENVQRDDLNAFDTMNAYVDLRTIHGSAEAVSQKTGKHKRTIEKYLKIHSEISALPELHEVVVANSGSAEYSTLSDLAGLSSQLKKMAKSNKRDFERSLTALRKDLKAGTNRLVTKFKESKQEPSASDGKFFEETTSELILRIRVKKAAVTAAHVSEIKASIETCLERLSELPVSEEMGANA